MIMRTVHNVQNTLNIPQDVLDSARMNLHDLKVELVTIHQFFLTEQTEGINDSFIT